MHADIKKLSVDPRAKGLIFDLDGTIADTLPIHFKAWQDLGKKYNFTLTKDLFQQLTGIPTHKFTIKLNEALGCTMEPDIAAKEKEEAFLQNFNKIKLIEPVMEIVRSYHTVLPMSIGTGGRKHIAMKTIEYLGLDKYFPVIITANDVTNHKPHPETFLTCAKKMNIEPHHCQVFEDGVQGLNAAKEANMIATDVRPFIG